MRMDDAPPFGAFNLKREHPPNLQSHFSRPWGTTAWRQDVPVSDRPHDLEAHSRWELWTSRRLRKGHGPLEQGKYRTLAPKHMVQALLRGKDVHRLEVRMAVAFIIGPLLFVIGSVLLMSKLGSGAALLAIGSVFFYGRRLVSVGTGFVGDPWFAQSEAALGLVWNLVCANSKHWHRSFQHGDIFKLGVAYAEWNTMANAGGCSQHSRVRAVCYFGDLRSS